MNHLPLLLISVVAWFQFQLDITTVCMFITTSYYSTVKGKESNKVTHLHVEWAGPAAGGTATGCRQSPLGY